VTAPDAALLLARAYLSRVAEPASIPVWRLVGQCGAVEAARLIRAGSVTEDVGRATSSRRLTADPEADLEAAERHGIRLVTPESPDWPHFAFAALEAAAVTRLAQYEAGALAHREGGEPLPPLALWVRGNGDLRTAGIRSVAIVGARAATAYGEQVTSELAYGLARAGVTIVSGGAYGIDAVAHRGALAGGGASVIVSAGGLDRPYPVGNAALYTQVARDGLIVGESPPGCSPQRHRFLSRNRLIAALSSGTVVVEAAARSGALNTAAHCVAIGRPLMAVPGPITSAMSVGCHRLIRRESDPAVLVSNVDEVLAIVGSVGEGLDPVEAPATGTGLRDRLDQLDPAARRVFDGLPGRRPVTEDELAVLSGVNVLEVMRALPVLQLAGLVVTGDDGYRLARIPR
jgi:DNA processing protein